MADIVDDFLTRVARAIPAANDALPQLEAELRQHWGGQESYVRKHRQGQRPDVARARQRVQAIAHGLQQGQPLADILRSAAIPPQTGYRLLKRKA
jgi:cell fate (sporulation/competence/biofilm development) regulator YlbF (YheA/YmcA/DUF963 family)